MVAVVSVSTFVKTLSPGVVSLVGQDRADYKFSLPQTFPRGHFQLFISQSVDETLRFSPNVSLFILAGLCWCAIKSVATPYHTLPPLPWALPDSFEISSNNINPLPLWIKCGSAIASFTNVSMPLQALHPWMISSKIFPYSIDEMYLILIFIPSFSVFIFIVFWWVRNGRTTSSSFLPHLFPREQFQPYWSLCHCFISATVQDSFPSFFRI